MVYNYLCNAAVILAAHKLGFNVGNVSFAENILRTKTVPEVTTLGFFIRQKDKAIEVVNFNKKGEEADKIAYNILRDYGCIK